MNPRLPTFLIIGAQKSATRWLRSNLGLHPGIFTATREQEFFNHQWQLGVEWYAEQFADAGKKRHVGEATPGYMMLNEEPALQAARIDGLLPDVRLFAILRNPVDRTFSAFVHFMRDGEIGTNESLIDRLDRVPIEDDRQCLVGGSLYYHSLRPYLERFGDRLLILLQDDLKRDAAGVYKRALRHISADQDFVPKDIGTVRFSNPTPQDSEYGDGGVRRELLPAERRKIFEYFEDDLRQLESATSVSVRRWWPR